MTVTQAKTISTTIGDLASNLAQVQDVVFDFESSSVTPDQIAICGLGLYLPDIDRRYYINIGHGQVDKRYPKHSATNVINVLQPFFDNRENRAIAHNASFDLRLLIKLGVEIGCQTICTLTNLHRVDENLHYCIHPRTDSTYGLKQLNVAIFNRSPPRLFQVTGGKNVLSASIHATAQYCMLDVENTWDLHCLAMEAIENDLDLKRMIREIDNPSQAVVAKMMYRGVGINVSRANQTRSHFESLIDNCRAEIERIVGFFPHINKKSDQCKFLVRLGQNQFRNQANIRGLQLLELIETHDSKNIRRVACLLFLINSMRDRINNVLKPSTRNERNNRIFLDRFSSTLRTTRYSSSPNLQNLPKRADGLDISQELVPDDCYTNLESRQIIEAKSGYMLVSFDLKSAEVFYLAQLSQDILMDRENFLLAEKTRLQRLRWNRYPILMRRKSELADNAVLPASNEIEWPEPSIDPLWKSLSRGLDPYNELLKSVDQTGWLRAVEQGLSDDWLKSNRWRGKRAFLALAYGASPEGLAAGLKWSLSKTQRAFEQLKTDFSTIDPFEQLTQREITQIGQVRSLWNRPYRINGFFQLTRPQPINLRYKLQHRKFDVEIIPLGTTYYGVQAFVKSAYLVMQNHRYPVLLGNEKTGNVDFIDESSPLVCRIREHQFNNPPFGNFQYSNIVWVDDEFGYRRRLEKIERTVRQAFNARCQSTGADHLRWLMIEMDKLCSGHFHDCHLILTVHDSLLYEVPRGSVDDFVAAAMPIVTRQPFWTNLPIKVDVEFGENFGSLGNYQFGSLTRARAPARVINTLCTWAKRMWRWG